jgi:ArsR family transcriptional regulator, virulence genes transcriptional regulator
MKNQQEKRPLDSQKLIDAAEMLKAIAHPSRINIIDLLDKKGELSVTQIQEMIDLEQAQTSHHLRILKDKNILNCRRDGKNMYYSLKFEKLVMIIECIENYDK